MLESSQVPNQSAMVAFIRRGMMKLRAVSIKIVKVYGKLAEASTLAWSQDIDLEDAIALSCPSTNPVSQIASSKQKSTKRHWPSQFMPFKVLYRTLTPNTSRQVGNRSNWLHHRDRRDRAAFSIWGWSGWCLFYLQTHSRTGDALAMLDFQPSLLWSGINF